MTLSGQTLPSLQFPSPLPPPPLPQVYVVEGQGGEAPKVQTDGINFVGAWGHADILDVNTIITNDVAAMLNT